MQHECICSDLVFPRRSYLYLEEMAVSEGILAVKIEGHDVTWSCGWIVDDSIPRARRCWWRCQRLETWEAELVGWFRCAASGPECCGKLEVGATGHALEGKEMEEEEFSCLTWRAAAKLAGEHELELLCKVETPYHDNDLSLTPKLSPQSGWQWTLSCPELHMGGFRGEGWQHLGGVTRWNSQFLIHTWTLLVIIPLASQLFLCLFWISLWRRIGVYNTLASKFV